MVLWFYLKLYWICLVNQDKKGTSKAMLTILLSLSRQGLQPVQRNVGCPLGRRSTANPPLILRSNIMFCSEAQQIQASKTTYINITLYHKSSVVLRAKIICL